MNELELLMKVENKARAYLAVKKSWDNRLGELIRLNEALGELYQFRLSDQYLKKVQRCDECHLPNPHHLIGCPNS